MNQPAAASLSYVETHQPLGAAAIPKLSREEVIPLAREELNRFMALLETLSPAHWTQPTDCALWTVKDVVAHQASHVLGLTHFRELLNQFNPLNFRDYMRRGINLLDAANQRQVDKRAALTSAQLIAEIRDHQEASLIGRQRFPSLLRWIPIRTPGYEYTISLGELIDNIFTRDMWIHRLDICRAAKREMALTPEHDSRITELAMRDLAQNLAPKLKEHGVIYELTGKTGGTWAVGTNSPAATITIDVFEFHRLASGRIKAEQALEQGLVTIDGDQRLASLALQYSVVLY